MTLQIMGVDAATVRVTVGCAALVLCLSVALAAWRLRSRRSPAAKWPEARGTLLSASVQVAANGGGRHETPLVLYRYRVGADEFQGDCVRLDGRGTAASDTVARYPAGTCVPVFYDPGNPARSALER